jgi:hypothetical protein
MRFIENLIPEDYNNKIKRTLLSNSFYWYYQHPSSNGSVDRRELSSYDTGSLPPEINDLDDARKAQYLNFINQTPPYFNHLLFSNDNVESEHIEFVMKIMKTFQNTQDIICSRLVKAEGILLTKDTSLIEDNYSTPRPDSTNSLQENIYTLIYYVNNSDGGTYIFNEIYNHDNPSPELTIKHQQTPQEGCAILFEGDRFYADAAPKTGDNRAVIHITFETNEAISW